MNKLLIIFLAVCLISVHAYVKRDAPEQATEKNYLEELQKTTNELLAKVQEGLSKGLNPDTIKKNFNEFIDNASKQIDSLTPKKE